MHNEPHKFLKIYFIGSDFINLVDTERVLSKRVDALCDYNNFNSLKDNRIVGELEALMNEHNELLKFLKSINLYNLIKVCFIFTLDLSKTNIYMPIIFVVVAHN